MKIKDKIHINKLSDDAKKTMSSRTVTSVYVVLYTIGVLLLGLLGTPNNYWFKYSSITQTNNIIQMIFGISFLCSLMWMIYFVVKELTSCFLKNINKSIVIFLTILSISTCLVPTFIMFPYLYRFISFDPDYENIRNTFMGSFFGLLLIIYFFSLYLILKNQNKNIFNIIVFPIIFAVIIATFLWFFYLTLIKFWTAAIFLICVTYLTDSLAYLGGSLFGKHKMCPKISPKKTWEGFIISLFSSTLILCLLLFLYSLDKNVQLDIFGLHEVDPKFLDNLTWWWIFMPIFSFVLTCFDTFGDLSFSYIKRKNGIKDFSNLLPGHGGILDRIDALIFVVCFYTTVCFLTSLINDPSLANFFGLNSALYSFL